jgi:transposase
MEISVNSSIPKKNGLPSTPGLAPGAERREGERSETDRSAAPGASRAATPHPEVPADAKRRYFSAEYKLRILAEADEAKNLPGGVGALLRREGLYSSHLAGWRRERASGVASALAPKRRGPKPRRDPQHDELQRLRRENARLLDELDKAQLIIDVQKKVASLFGRELPKVEFPEKP